MSRESGMSMDELDFTDTDLYDPWEEIEPDEPEWIPERLRERIKADQPKRPRDCFSPGSRR